MAFYTTEEVRDSNGKIVTYRIVTYDALGRPVYTDVPATHAVGVQIADVVAAVATEAHASTVAKTAGGASSPVMPALRQALSAARVRQITRNNGNRKGEDGVDR